MDATENYYHIAWTVKASMDEVLACEHGPYAWTESYYTDWLRKRTAIGITCFDGGAVAGSMVYTITQTQFVIEHIMVSPDFKRQGVATAMVEKLKGKLGKTGKTRVVCHVPEHCDELVALLAKNGFTATGVCREHKSYGEDTIRFQYKAEN